MAYYLISIGSEIEQYVRWGSSIGPIKVNEGQTAPPEGRKKIEKQNPLNFRYLLMRMI